MTFCFFGCQNEDKSREIIKSIRKELITKNKTKTLDSCLLIVDRVIENNKDFFPAYDCKSFILTKKKDLNGLLDNNEKVIQLRPNQPIWIIQRGLFFDLKGNEAQADKYYKTGVEKYRTLLNSDNKLKNDINFRIEYLSALEINEELKTLEIERKKLKLDFPDNEFVNEFITLYKPKSKKEIMEIWHNQNPE